MEQSHASRAERDGDTTILLGIRGYLPDEKIGMGFASKVSMKSPFLNRNSRSKSRKARSGSTRVVVVEVEGRLMAIVQDQYRGVVEIPLGTIDPPISLAR